MRRLSIFNRRQRSSTRANALVPRLTWDVKIEPVSSGGTVAPDYKALHRDDNNYRLNIVSSKYNPSSNERLMTVVSKLHELSGFDVVGYSEYDNGRKVLAYLKNNTAMKIGDFDSTNYMVIGNSFDYSTSWFMGAANEVYRCSNQWGMLNVKNRFRHNSKLDEKIDELVHFYDDYVEQERLMKETFETWHGIRIPQELKELFADHVIGIDNKEDEETKVSSIKMNQRKNLFDSINKEVEAMGDTVYGLFNGLTHYTTHKSNSREKVFGNVLGHAATLNKRGFEMLSQYVADVV